MKSPFIKTLDLRSKQGQSAIALALLTITFLLLAGFAIDVANLLLKKSHLQRSLDAGAIAGITRYASGDASGTIADTAKKMAIYNLSQMGINSSDSNITADFPPPDSNGIVTLSLTGSINTKTLFMGLIPGAGLSTILTTASSKAQRSPAIISLVLDVSGSMQPNMTALKDAANAFVDSFENNIDQMALIEFNVSPIVLISMSPVNKTNLHNAINSLVSGGGTHTSGAIILGRKELEKITNPTSARSLILFTDGSPDVIRPIFTDGKPAALLPNYPRPPAIPKNYDYLLYSYTTTPEFHDPYNSNARVCASGTNPVGNCLNSFAYNDSRGNPGHFSHITSLASPYTEIFKENYDLAIIESDYTKAEGIIIYTIGLGTESTNKTSPYQNESDFSLLKPIFLRRIANDPASASDPQFPNLALNPADTKGVYLQTPKASDLKNLFNSIAQRIKLRLIQ